MEQLTEHLLEDPDSPMEDTLPIEPEPVTYYLPDSPGGQMHTLSPEESPIEPWQRWLTEPNSSVSHKHSLLPYCPPVSHPHLYANTPVEKAVTSQSCLLLHHP